MASSTKTQSAPVKSAMRTLDLIEFVVARSEAVSAQEISAALGIPLSSLSYLLSTLVERDYLRREGRQYSPGEGLARLGTPHIKHSLIDRARPIVKALRHQLNETASLFILTPGWEVEAVLTYVAGHKLRYSIDVGTRAPLHCVASGKAILAALPQPLLDEYFAQADLESLTPNTPTNPGKLRQDIARVREEGIAFNRNEYIVGVTAIGIALPPSSEGYAAISVGGPSARFGADVETRMARHLKEAAKILAAD